VTSPLTNGLFTKAIVESGSAARITPLERAALGEILTRLLRRVESSQPDAGGRLEDLD